MDTALDMLDDIAWDGFMTWDEVCTVVDQCKFVLRAIDYVDAMDLQCAGAGRFPFLDAQVDELYFNLLRSPLIPVGELALHILWDGTQIAAYIARTSTPQ